MSISVYIIESPSPANFLDGIHEGATLQAALKHAHIDARLFTAVNVKTFFEALLRVIDDMRDRAGKQVTPIVHLSMHGNSAGVALTSGEALEWEFLGDALAVANQALARDLLISMSTCEGFHGIKMAHRDGDVPFLGLLGPTERVKWSDTVAAFVAYYHHVEITAGETGKAVTIMNAVIDRATPPLFLLRSGFSAQRDYTEARFQAYLAEVAKQAGTASQPVREGMRGLIDAQQKRSA